MFEHEMGSIVTQRDSRYTGVVVARCEHVDYVQYLVRSNNLSKDGKPVEVWIGAGDLR